MGLGFLFKTKNKSHSKEYSHNCISKTMASKTIYFTPLKHYAWKQAYKRNNLFSKTMSFNQIRKEISKYDNKKYKPYIGLLEGEEKQYSWLKI